MPSSQAVLNPPLRRVQSTKKKDRPAVMDCSIKKCFTGHLRPFVTRSFQSKRTRLQPLLGHRVVAKSVLRCLNRMNDLIRGFRLVGSVDFRGQNIYGAKIDPIVVRRYIGMVFQQPNPFATSVYNNVAFGLRLNNFKGDRHATVEKALKSADLWDEVKDKLDSSGLSLSGGQQQRLCLARAIATEPEVLLLDEPCSALDPVATRKIEELMKELKSRFTIAIVTHNLAQAKRVADRPGFWYVDTSAGSRTGYLVEFGETSQIFDDPQQKETQQYTKGDFS